MSTRYTPVRLDGDLRTQIEADGVEAGEQKLSVTIHRLLHRGLGNPAMLPKEKELLLTIVGDLRRIGVNINQVAREANIRGVRGEVAAQEVLDAVRELDALKNRIAAIVTRYE